MVVTNWDHIDIPDDKKIVIRNIQRIFRGNYKILSYLKQHECLKKLYITHPSKDYDTLFRKLLYAFFDKSSFSIYVNSEGIKKKAVNIEPWELDLFSDLLIAGIVEPPITVKHPDWILYFNFSVSFVDLILFYVSKIK